MTVRSQHKQWFRCLAKEGQPSFIKGVKGEALSATIVTAKSVYLNDRPEMEIGC